MSEYETKYDSEFIEKVLRLPKPAAGYEWAPVEHEKGGSLYAVTFSQRPIRKLLDWSKVGGDVLVVTTGGDIQPMRYPTNHKLRGFYEGWQVHLGGECPVDPLACMVEVVFRSRNYSRGLAAGYYWSDITAYRVVSLVPGYEYP